MNIYTKPTFYFLNCTIKLTYKYTDTTLILGRSAYITDPVCLCIDNALSHILPAEFRQA